MLSCCISGTRVKVKFGIWLKELSQISELAHELVGSLLPFAMPCLPSFLPLPPFTLKKGLMSRSLLSWETNDQRHHFPPSLTDRPSLSDSLVLKVKIAGCCVVPRRKERQGSMVWHFSAPALMAGQLNSVSRVTGKERGGWKSREKEPRVSSAV